jgi:tetratricopeptide (TPR) repeat protein
MTLSCGAQHRNDVEHKSTFDESYKLIADVDLALLTSVAWKDGSLPLRWGNRLALEGRWREAEKAYKVAVKIKWHGADPIADEDFLPMLPLLVQSGDLQSSNAYLSRGHAGFAGTPRPEAAERAAKACLIVPLKGDELVMAVALADRAVTIQPDHWVMPDAECMRSLAAYRAGEYQKAIDWSQLCLSRPDSSSVWFRTTQAHLVIAMAHAKLERYTEAIVAYEKAVEILDHHAATVRKSGFDMNWTDWLVSTHLKQEAYLILNEHD